MAKLLSYVFLLIASLVVANAQSIVDQADDGSSGKISFKTPDLSDEEAHSPWMPSQLKCDACKIVTYQLYDKFDKFNKVNKHYKFKLPESEVLDLIEGVCQDSKIFEGYGIKQIKKEQRLTGPGAEGSDVPGVTAGGGKWPTSYGLKQVKGVHRLSGPGTDAVDEPGIMQGGGKWPGRYVFKDVQGVHRLTGPGFDIKKPGVIQGGGKWPGRLMDMCEQYAADLGEMELYDAYKKNPKSRKSFEKFLCYGKGKLGECSNLKGKDEL